jgi:hypothetical protein
MRRPLSVNWNVADVRDLPLVAYPTLRYARNPVAGSCPPYRRRYDDNSGHAAPGAEDCQSGSQHSEKMAPLGNGAK